MGILMDPDGDSDGFRLLQMWFLMHTDGAAPRQHAANAGAMTPSADPAYLGLKQFDGFIGFKILPQKGALAGYGLAVEAGLPFWQSTSGPGMARSYFMTLGLTRYF